jgi:ribonuclease HIII
MYSVTIYHIYNFFRYVAKLKNMCAQKCIFLGNAKYNILIDDLFYQV